MNETLGYIYLRPEWSLLILACAIFAFLYKKLYDKRKEVQEQFSAVFSVHPTATSRSRFWLRASLLLFSWILIAEALMQPAEVLPGEPVKNEEAIIKKPPFDEIAFILDASQSMACRDTTTGDSRFDRAKELIGITVEKLAGIPISLYTIAGTFNDVCPATMDYLYLRLVLQDLLVNDTPLQGSDFSQLADGIRKRYGEMSTRRRTLFILLSDGEDTSLTDLSEDERKNREELLAADIVEAAGDPKSQFDAVGFGSSRGAAIPDVLLAGRSVHSFARPHFLQVLAIKGNGHFFFEKDFALPQIANELYIDAEGSFQSAPSKDPEIVFKTHSSYPVIFAILFLALSFFIPETAGKK